MSVFAPSKLLYGPSAAAPQAIALALKRSRRESVFGFLVMSCQLPLSGLSIHGSIQQALRDHL
jgi:hypothetical protein